MREYVLTKTLLSFVIMITTVLVNEQCGLADQYIARESLPSNWKADAELTDVFFLNEQLGWAVGAQGVILRTSNGGGSWQEISQANNATASELPLDEKLRYLRTGQRTRSTGVANFSESHRRVSCRFESVHFVDANHGWVAGGYDVPYVGRSRAVVMRTNDGGMSWHGAPNLVIPRINRIKFSDPKNGWAIGETGNLFQTGIFFTSNGGQTWSSQTADRLAGWIDAERVSGGFATINYDGRLGLLKSGKYEASVIQADAGNAISNLRMSDNKTGWAVGENGTLLQTNNGGLSWSNAALPLIEKLTKQIDFKTIAVSERKICFAGDPGSYLFTIDRITGKPQAFRTPIHSRINKIHFVSDLVGWAVGSYGTIMVTADGGQTWRVQRGDNRRSALVCVSPNQHSIPFEILSKYATEEHRICTSVLLNTSIKENQIATQATERLGGVATIGISTNADRRETLRKMVRVLRSTQPNVVVCNAGHSLGFSGATGHGASRINPVILLEDAIRMAADRNAFPEQISDIGLSAWKVDRLAILDSTGKIKIDPHRLLPHAGVLIEDQIAISRGLVGQSVIVSDHPNYRVSHFSRQNKTAAGDLLHGLGLQEPIPTRKETQSKRGSLAMIRHITEKRQRFEQFVQFEAKTAKDMLVWRQQIQSFAMSMDRDVAGVWLMQLAERYLEVGKTELAAASTRMMTLRWPDHAFSPAGLTWLAHYYASDEFAQIEYLNQKIAGARAPAEDRNRFDSAPQVVNRNGNHLVWVPTEAMIELDERVKEEAAIGLVNHEVDVYERPEFFKKRLAIASQYLSQLSQRDPELIAGPQYRMLEAQISRRINGAAGNEGRFKNLLQKHDFTGVGISLGAQRELGLHGLLRESSAPIGALKCSKTNDRPNLDGKLDEAFWKSAITNGNFVSSEIQSSGQVNKDVAVFAYDDEFLYAGFICHKIRGQYYNSRKLARPRDADLSRRDRIEFSIDLDRDYRTSSQFVVDHRGWVNESCTGATGWNPDWYVSQTEDELKWTVEFAIPLAAIMPTQIEHGTTWAFQVARRGYDQRNMWQKNTNGAGKSENGSTIGAFVGTGLQLGLKSRPAQFELIRFEDPAENVSTD
ncbi:MAG: hypothetical protein AB8B55_11630 [Mariniblastus sp.]